MRCLLIRFEKSFLFLAYLPKMNVTHFSIVPSMLCKGRVNGESDVYEQASCCVIRLCETGAYARS